MSQPKTDAELVVEIIERAEELLDAVKKTREALATLGQRHRLSDDLSCDIVHILELTDKVAE